MRLERKENKLRTVVSLIGESLDVLFNRFVVLLDDRLDKTSVEDRGTHGRRQIKPEKEESLEEPVNRKYVDNRVREELNNRKNGENYPKDVLSASKSKNNKPVSQPLGVIFFVVAFDSENAAVCRINESHCVADQSSEVAKD